MMKYCQKSQVLDAPIYWGEIKGNSTRTGEAYATWVKRFIFLH
jgi:hypothetical protein